MRNARNLAANLTAFVVTFAISFFLSPFIVRTLGVEANGLIGLSTNFLNYASVLTITLASMTARFVTIELRAGNQQAADEYYTAAYAGTLMGVAVLLPPMALTVVNFGVWLNVPTHLVADAQLLSGLLFVNFLLPLIFPDWKVGTWATNKLFLDSLRTMQSVLLRGGLILVFFFFLQPRVAYVGFATLVAGIFALAFNAYYKRRLLPSLRVRPSNFRWSRLWELLKAGCWNSVNYLGNLLTTGFHLLLANLFLGATSAGLLALAMTVPGMVNQLAINLSRVFQPSLAFAFAARDHHAMQQQARRAMSITSLLTTMPLGALFVFGDAFFGLWVPSENEAKLSLMSVAAAAGFVVACAAQPLQNVFVITNAQRAHSIASVSMGVANVALAVVLLNFTGFGVFAILASAAFTILLRVLIFTIPMAAHRVQAASGPFMLEIARSIGYLTVLVGVGGLIRLICTPTSWGAFILAVGIMCICGSLINLLLLAERSDRGMAFNAARRLFTRNR